MIAPIMKVDLMRKYAFDGDEPRVVTEHYSLPGTSCEAARLQYLIFDDLRERAAGGDLRYAMPNNEKGEAYLFLLMLWADAIFGEGIDRVELVEETPGESFSSPVIIINETERIEVPTMYGEVVPEIADCLMVALGASSPDYPGSENSGRYNITGGTMTVEQADTFSGSTKPVRVILERSA